MLARWPFLTLFLTIFGSLQPGFAHGDEISELKITRPYIYKITGGRGVSYLFGTVHIGLSATQLPSWILDLHDRTALHAYEINFGFKGSRDELSHAQNMYFNPAKEVADRKRLAQGRKNSAYTTERLMLFGFPKMLAPYMLEKMPGNEKLDACEYAFYAELFFDRPIYSLDFELQLRSYLNRKPVWGLENFKIRRDADKHSGVKEDLCDISKLSVWEVIKTRERLVEVLVEYAAGDVAQDPETDLSVEYRNRIWAKKLENQLKQTSIFIAVGVNHLKGLIPMLEAQGYKVERIENAAQAGL